MKKIILASASPRRKELLQQMGLSYTVILSDYDESLFVFSGDVVSDAEQIALNKILHSNAVHIENALAIGADTIVELNGDVFGKPKDEDDAKRMLTALSGKVHRVITGLAVLDTDSGRHLVSHEITDVHFAELSQDEIDAYISTGEYVDKAGAYAIQGSGALFVRKINGCYYNVVGLPLLNLKELLLKFGFNMSLSM